MSDQRFIEVSRSFFVSEDFEQAFENIGLTSFEAIFSFNKFKDLTKNNLAQFRTRGQFEIDLPQAGQTKTLFLKRYNEPPIHVQLKNWLSAHKRKSCGLLEYETADALGKAGINIPRTVAYGGQYGLIFEKRSFIITEKIPDADVLERRLPEYFNDKNKDNLRLQRNFIAALAGFIRKFHQSGFCHRDLYFSHIFHSTEDKFYLIDLARAFKPVVLRRRFQLKDLAQLFYSAPGRYFSKTDRLRFYFSYSGQSTITKQDKVFIGKLLNKVRRMANHNKKHGRYAPFEKV
jgi:tRNA A-37 threonylcarbamoyl transferase component Bud32